MQELRLILFDYLAIQFSHVKGRQVLLGKYKMESKGYKQLLKNQKSLMSFCLISAAICYHLSNDR